MNPAWKTTGIALALAAGAAAWSGPVAACNDQPYMGTVCAFGFNYCPRGYMPADGRLLSISQYTALFSLFGTLYGGDGRTTFGVPDLRGRSLVGVGAGPGLSPIQLGQMGGAEQVTLSLGQMPAHTHPATTNVSVSATARAQSGAGNTDSPTGHSPAVLSRSNIYSTAAPDVDMAGGTVAATASATTTVGIAGSSQPVPIRSPYLGINYCVSTEGIYPPRN